MNDSSDSQSQVKDEQSRPKVWMAARMLKEQTHKVNETVGKFCYVCTVM